MKGEKVLMDTLDLFFTKKQKMIEKVKQLIQTDREFSFLLEPGERWVVDVKLKREKAPTLVKIEDEGFRLRYPTPEEWKRVIARFKRPSLSKTILQVLQHSQPMTLANLREAIMNRDVQISQINKHLAPREKDMQYRIRRNPETLEVSQQLVELVVLDFVSWK